VRVIISEEKLKRRIAELGQEISSDLSGKDPLIVSILRGGFIFTADLVRLLDFPHEIDFILASSYGDGTSSSGAVRLLKDLNTGVQGRHLLLVDDIIDTGLTINYISKSLGLRNPASLAIAALLEKEIKREFELPTKYVGFRIPDTFVVGYGLDHRQRYRHLPFIAELDGMEATGEPGTKGRNQAKNQ
jgi:hypoxanthine phosphoribosyltransferase